MKNNFFAGFFIFILIILVCFAIVSSLEFFEINLNQGENFIAFNNSQNFYVSTLIKLNPEIEAVSYFENGKSIGYVNVFGGIGEDFIIVPNKTYEIFAKKNISLNIPY